MAKNFPFIQTDLYRNQMEESNILLPFFFHVFHYFDSEIILVFNLKTYQYN
jgi:hypothetical protein